MSEKWGGAGHIERVRMEHTGAEGKGSGNTGIKSREDGIEHEG